MVNGRKISGNVTLQAICFAPPVLGFPDKRLQPVGSGMGASVLDTGKGISDKGFFKNRRDHLAQRLLNNPIAERQGLDKPAFGLENIKAVVFADLVCARFELALYVQDAGGQMIRKRQDASF